MSAAAPPPPVNAAPPTLEGSGLLAVDKPPGVTSHDVVALVRRRLGAPGAGHLGTLDPAATGLLLVARGAATRCVPFWQGGEKTYEATVRFGVVTDTQDLTGTVLARSEVACGEEEIRSASRAFVGEFDQLPPMVSALKVGGERLHRLARRGVSVERTPRRVRVAEWTWLGFALPEARLRVRCSGGTYVRTLAHDLGAKLGCGAVIAALRRLRSEPFDLSRSVTLAELRTLGPEEILERGGIPLASALAHFPRVEVGGEEAVRIGHGHPLLRPAAEVPAGASSPAGPPAPVVLCDASGVPLAIGERLADPAETGLVRLQPRLVFPWAARGDLR